MNRDDLMDVDMAVMDFMRDHPDAPMAKIIRAAVEAAEPLIRADERQRAVAAYHVAGTMVRADERAELRAKVEALLPERSQPQYLSGWDAALADVLALLDGGSE